ncbi:MAG: HAD family hydrolase [Bacteroidales bacterium]
MGTKLQQILDNFVTFARINTLKQMNKMKDFGVIFDMDGTIICNVSYHILAFQEFCKRHGLVMLKENFHQYNGMVGSEIMRSLFGQHLSDEETKLLEDEKEAIYRDLYRPHLALTAGLATLLEELKKNNIPMSVGSSAPDDNIDFILDGLNIRHYFKAIINASQITHGKPHPEVFLKAAEAMQLPASRCVVMEDALAGVEAALRAKMKVIGITSICSSEELSNAHITIPNFTDVNLQTIANLLD